MAGIPLSTWSKKDSTTPGGAGIPLSTWNKTTSTSIKPTISTTPEVDTNFNLLKETFSKDSLSQASKKVSDFLINKPIKALGEKLYNSNKDFFDQAVKGIDIQKSEGKKNLGEEILSKGQYGMGTIEGLTGDNLKPEYTEEPKDFLSKAIHEVSYGIGMAGAIESIGGTIFNKLKAPEVILSKLKSYPKVAQYFNQLARNIPAFTTYGQISVDQSNKERVQHMIKDIYSAPVYTALGFIKNSKLRVPTAGALGFGIAKLGGASNEDALVSATAFVMLDIASSQGKRTPFKENITKEEAQNILLEEANNVIEQNKDKPNLTPKEQESLNNAQDIVAGNEQQSKPITLPETHDMRTVMERLSSSGYSKDQVIKIMTELYHRNQSGKFTPGEVANIASLYKPVNSTKKGLAIIREKVSIKDKKQEGLQVTQKALELTKKNGGVTINLDGDVPISGFAYSPFKDIETTIPKEQFSEKNIDDFIDKHYDKLNQEGNHLGIWEDNGKIYIDISKVNPDEQLAVTDAAKNNQLALFDLSTFETKYIKDYEKTNNTYKYKKQIQGTNQEGDIGTIKKEADSNQKINNKINKQSDGQSAVFKRIQEEYPQLEGELNYDVAKLETESKEAVDLIAKDKQEAFRLAMEGGQTSDIKSVMANIALSQQALREGNYKLFEQLVRNRSIAQTRRGQGIVAEKASITDNSTERYVKELLATRLEGVGDKYLSDLSLKKASSKEKGINKLNKEVETLEKVIKSKKLDTKSALKLLDKITCL